MRDVADGLGRSRTSLYRLWDSQEDLWVDLSRYLVLEHDLNPRGGCTVPWRAAAAALEHVADTDQPTLVQALGDGLNLAQEAVLADQGVLLRAALLGYGQVEDLAALRRAVEERRLHDLGALLGGVLALHRRWVAPPLTPVGAATALWALGDGLAVVHRFVPEVGELTVPIDDKRGPRPWRLFAYGARCLLVEATTGQEQAGHDPAHGTASLADQRERQLARWTPAQREVLHAASLQYVRRTAPGGDISALDEVRALPQITMASVAHAAGVSRRAVYNMWPSISDLRLELLQMLLTAERTNLLTRFDRLTAELDGRPATAQQLLLALARSPARERLSAGHARLAFLPEANHPAVQAITGAAVRSTIAALAERLEARWPAPGRGPGPGLDARGLAALVLALVNGGERLLRINPASLGVNRKPDSRQPDPLAVLLHAVLTHDPQRAHRSGDLSDT
jgi:AcrR family transcriptional regulator